MVIRTITYLLLLFVPLFVLLLCCEFINSILSLFIVLHICKNNNNDYNNVKNDKNDNISSNNNN